MRALSTTCRAGGRRYSRRPKGGRVRALFRHVGWGGMHDWTHGAGSYIGRSRYRRGSSARRTGGSSHSPTAARTRAGAWRAEGPRAARGRGYGFPSSCRWERVLPRRRTMSRCVAARAAERGVRAAELQVPPVVVGLGADLGLGRRARRVGVGARPAAIALVAGRDERQPERTGNRVGEYILKFEPRGSLIELAPVVPRHC